MTQRKLDEFPSSALTEDECREFRRLLEDMRHIVEPLKQVVEDHKKAKWLWGTLHRVGIAIAAVAAFLGAVKVLLGSYWNWK